MLSDMGMMINRRRVYGGKKGLLPSGYTQVEYIESTGTQYIDTSVIPNVNLGVYFDFQFTYPHNAANAINGVRNSTSMNTRFYFSSTYSSTKWRTDWGNLEQYHNGILDRHKVQYNIENHALIIDDVLVGTLPLSSINLSNYNKTIWLFYGNNENPFSNAWSCKEKVFACDIYDDSFLIRNYIPCISPNNVVGMYDTIEGKFYSSPNGVAFVAGPVV